MDELPPDDPNTPGDSPDAPGSRRRARRRDRAARIVGARTAEDLTAERPRPVIPEPPAPAGAPPPPPPPPAAGDEELWEAEDESWEDEATPAADEGDGEWEDDATSATGAEDGAWEDDPDAWESDDEVWEDEGAEPEEQASHFGAIPVIRPGDPPPPGVEIPEQPAPVPPPPVAEDEDEAWEDDEQAWEDEAWEEEAPAATTAVEEDGEWEDETWEDEVDEPTAAMAVVPPPPPPPPPPPSSRDDVPPVVVEDDEYDEYEYDDEYDEPEQLLEDGAPEGARLGVVDAVDHELHDDVDEPEPTGPPPLRLADELPPDEPASAPWAPEAGEVDDVSGMPPDDDDLLSSPRGWDDEDDGLDALIPRRTGQTEAVRPEAPPPEPDLQPWDEPGTGEVPAAVRGDEDDLDAWSGIANAPRWRDQGGDEWEAEEYDDLAAEDETQLGGAYDDGLDEEPVVVFDDVPVAPLDDEPAPPHDPYPADPRRGGLLGGGGPPQEPGSDARDLPVAVGVGVGLAAAFLVLMAIRPGAAMLLIGPALVLAVAEFYTAVRRAGYAPINLLGIVAVAGLAFGTFWRGEAAMPLVLFLTVVAGLLWYLLNPGDRVVPNVGITVLGVLWIGLLGSFAALMLTIPQNGTGILTGAILVTVAHDVVGLVVGSRMGRSPLSSISPGKTMEGAIGGVGAAIVVGLIVGVLLDPWTPVTGIQLGLVGGVMALAGDLGESVLKRDLGIKDMGSILPGHGGLLDRFDGLLFVLPATYYVVVVNDFLF